jgi:hypothetical protein
MGSGRHSLKRLGPGRFELSIEGNFLDSPWARNHTQHAPPAGSSRNLHELRVELIERAPPNSTRNVKSSAAAWQRDAHPVSTSASPSEQLSAQPNQEPIPKPPQRRVAPAQSAAPQLCVVDTDPHLGIFGVREVRHFWIGRPESRRARGYPGVQALVPRLLWAHLRPIVRERMEDRPQCRRITLSLRR